MTSSSSEGLSRLLEPGLIEACAMRRATRPHGVSLSRLLEPGLIEARRGLTSCEEACFCLSRLLEPGLIEAKYPTPITRLSDPAYPGTLSRA